jgi:hypothetical protein
MRDQRYDEILLTLPPTEIATLTPISVWGNSNFLTWIALFTIADARSVLDSPPRVREAIALHDVADTSIGTQFTLKTALPGQRNHPFYKAS